LRLQVLPGFALDHLGEVIRDFTALHPRIEVDLSVDDAPVNPVDKGYDVSLQIFRPGAEMLIERPLFPVSRVFCAAPEYLALHPAPEVPADLTSHHLGLYSAYPTRDRWSFRRGDEEISLILAPSFRCNSIHVLRDFALSGGGITCLPTFVCGKELLNGKLQLVLREYKLAPLELLAIYPVTHRRALKVKLFVDYIAQRYSGNLPWDEALRLSSELTSGAVQTSASQGSIPGSPPTGTEEPERASKTKEPQRRGRESRDKKRAVRKSELKGAERH
jgi:DNA-binding transcriptional LysR family regulator